MSGRSVLRPDLVCGVLYPRMAAPPTSTPTPLPGLRLPVARRRLGGGAALSFLVHAGVIALLVLRGRELLQRAGGGAPGERGGGAAAGGRPPVNFFTLPPAASPAAVAVPEALRVSPSDLRALRDIPVDLPRIELPRVTLAPGAVVVAGGPGGGAGVGRPGAGTGAGADVGPGTGGEGGYIVPAQPRRVLPWPPKCASRGPMEVRFWVAADGSPTRVEVEPAPPDARCRQQFVDLMMETRFYPARRNGQPVASVFSIRYSLGN